MERPNHPIIENNHMGSFTKHPLPKGYTSKDLDDIKFTPRVDDYKDDPTHQAVVSTPRSPLPGGISVSGTASITTA